MIDKNKHYFVEMHPLERWVTPFATITFKSSSTQSRWVECEVDESKYKLKDNYKITLRAIDTDYGSEDFYLCDFESLLENGFILEKTNDNQHIENVTWFEPLCGAAYLVHNANVVVN